MYDPKVFTSFFYYFYLESVFPPVFGRRLQAQVVKKDDRVLMDVEITGTPEPKVTWYKNDLPLEQAMVSEYSLQQVGISYKLIIDNGIKNPKNLYNWFNKI